MERVKSAYGGPEPIAIVGFSFELPGGCDTAETFWQTLLDRRNTATEAPEDRYSAESIFHPDAGRRGTVAFRGGHFLTRDISKFDAPFFSISDTEAAALDPQQRILLETTFRALENAGQVLDQVVGSNTSVFTGCFADDWKFLQFKDGEQCPSHTALGIESSMLANRLSWFFNFKGASCNIDSACSSSLLGVDLACKSLANGDVDMSIAAGTNLILHPDTLHGLSNLGLLSPDNQSYSFDVRANGYARGEGIGVLVLKRLSDAIANNDCIRAVIRGSGSNQDGYTPNITQPNGKAHAELMRRTYARAGLSLAETRFVESHGTGTQTGDPIEIEAIGSTFREYRSADEPLYVGAVKSNIGHLEGGSGIAGIIKAVLVLEKGIIPPNTNFETLNPKIDLDYLRIRLPQKATQWPSKGLRRASVNSFGFGGANSHIILDDAYHYLRSAGLKGNHNTFFEPETPELDYVDIGANGFLSDGSESGAVQDHSLTYPAPPKLIVLSANDKATLSTQAKNYGTFLHDTHLLADDDLLNDLAYTLNERRRAFAWRSAAVVHSPNDLKMLESLLSKPQRYTEEADLCCVFTGQGAQYPGQDLRCLEQFKVVQHVLDEAESYLAELGCQWGVRDELYKPVDLSRISEAEFSQPLSTIVQIALIDLFRSFGVYPSSVVGHSSGEMAAAYCAGALSARSAIKVAYFRGQHSSTLAASGAYEGAMMAASLSVQEAQSCIDDLASHTGGPKLTIACLNSPKSVTISGDSAQLDLLGEVMSLKGVFNRKLNVNMAYHSPAMHAVAQAYHASIGKLEKGTPLPHPVTMVSTVTGKWVGGDVLRNPQYWVDNMISPVLFSPVVEGFTFQTNRKVWKRLDCSHRNHPRVTFMLELGFHGAMRGPLRDILSKAPDGTKVKYETALIRNHSPTKTLFASLGELFNHGCHVDLGSVNAPREKAPRAPKLLCDLPQYQFNHSKSYWEESRISKNYRLLPQKKLDLLGKPSPDWNKAEAKWRNNIRTSEMPWVEDHKISGSVIYPGAGMIVMAIEAANQLADKGREIEGFELRDIRFLSTLSVPRTSNGIETHLYLREIRDASSSETPWSDFRLFCYENEDWTENCRGFVRVQYKPVLEGSDSGAMEFEKIEEVAQCLARESLIQDPEGHEFHHTELYDFIRESGFDYGASFQLLHNGVFKSKDGRADIQLYQWPEDAFPQSHIVHPCSLDAILHLTVAALAEGGRTAIPTAVPSAMKRLWISKHGLSSADATSVRATGWLTEQDTRGTEYNLSVLDATGSKVLLQGEGLRLTIVSGKDFSKTAQSDENQICYHLDWQLAPDSAVKANGVSNGVNGLNGINGRSNGTQIVTNGCHSQPRFVVVANLNLDSQRDLAQRLESVVTEDYFIMSLKEAAQLENKTETSFIFLEELNGPKLMHLSEIDYAALQNILTACKASLWVTNGGGKASQHPSTGVSNGLFRVLRNERPDRPYGILGLDIRCPITESQVTLIHKTFQKITHLEDPSISDQEYLEIEGKLHVPRVTEAKDITETVYQGSLVRRSAIKPLSSCPPVQLTIESTGFLDTLRFTEDDTYDQPLAQGEVEVKVSAVGLNFRDLLAALGRIPSNAFGSEAAGIVTRVGSDSLGFAPGDRVVMATASTFRTFVRAEAFRVLKIDDSMSFTEAATLPTQFCTAYISLYELARLQPDETVLIHTGAGGTSQAAIQVAQYIGATVYVTVGSEAKKRLVMEEYGIPESHIFYSRNTSFAKGIKRVTNGRGVDVILNSLSGDALISSWECIAPYGRFVEIGKKDVLGNTSLPMGMFRQNVQFLCFDGFTMQTERPVQFEKLFQRVLALFRKGALRPVKPLNVFPVSKVEDAFRAMQDGKSAGKFVLEFADDMEVKTTLQTRPSFVVDDSSTYVIAGGLGGLGRNVARWLVDRGAKHMLLLSRSGAQKEAAQEFLAELEGKGVVARAPPCDVTDLDALKNVIEECARDMPPIRGCVQGSMVLRDATFDKMSYADWRVGTDCKTVGSWNLHEVLPNELDFFIMLSSASGVVGLHGQANYAAGNAYMDALARYRVSRGLRATSLDLGALTEDGLLAENKDFLNRVLSYGALNGISRTYFNAIMDYYCNPSLPRQAPMQSQPIIGLGTGDDGIIISRQPIFKHLVTTKKATEASVPGERPQDWKSIFAHNSNEDIAHLVTQALIRKLAKTNSSLQGEVDVFKPLVAYGVDSLLAVELRSWLVKEFGADVALFEIQGGVGFEGLGRIVANRSSVGKKMGVS